MSGPRNAGLLNFVAADSQSPHIEVAFPLLYSIAPPLPLHSLHSPSLPEPFSILETVYHATQTVLGNLPSLTCDACWLAEATNYRTSRITDLGRRGRTAARNSVVPIVHLFTQANQIGIALHRPSRMEKADLLKVAAVEASPHSGLRPQARTRPLWARNGATLALGMTT